MNQVNGYDAIIVKGAPRFRLDKKLIARDKVPLDVQYELIAQINDKDAVRTVAPAPDVEATYTEENPTTEPVEIDTDGMEDNPYIEAGAPEVFPIPEAAVPDPVPMQPEVTERLAYDIAQADRNTSAFTQMELELLEENQRIKQQLYDAEMSKPSNKELTAQELGIILINDYGIYTALAGRDPEVGDIHPMSLKPMNRYDTGLAYAERKKSFNQEVKPYEPTPLPQENPVDEQEPSRSNGGFPSFATRTGVSFGAQSSSTMQQHTNDPINEEATAEPNLRGVTIRRYW